MAIAARPTRFFYSVGSRGIEYDLLPWSKHHGAPVMAYPRSVMVWCVTPHLQKSARHTAAAVALAWAIRSGDVIAIPESGSAPHVKENAVALSLELSPQDLSEVDAAIHRRPQRFLWNVQYAES